MKKTSYRFILLSNRFKTYWCFHCHLEDDFGDDAGGHRSDDDAGHMLNRCNLTYLPNYTRGY